MDTLTTAWPPTTETKTTQTVRAISNHYIGDAKQDTPDGINAAPTNFSGVWQMRQADTDALVKFLRTHTGKTFAYRLPQEATARTWQVTQWTRTPFDWDHDELRATFEEKFE